MRAKVELKGYIYKMFPYKFKQLFQGNVSLISSNIVYVILYVIRQLSGIAQDQEMTKNMGCI